MSKELEYGKWYPISVYYENQDKLDWVLVQFKETKTGFMPLPYRAEFLKRDGVWITHSDKDRYLCELCEPIAFMLWKPYNEDSSLESIENAKPSEALNYVNQFINEMTRCLENPKQYAKDYDKEIFYKYKYTFETTIKQMLIKAQEQEKILKIIKEKEVNIAVLNQCEDAEEYNKVYRKQEERQLTQEEFELLKR